MSIYASTWGVGDLEDPDSPGVVLIRMEKNRRGALDGAEIPSWCVDEDAARSLRAGPTSGSVRPKTRPS